MLTRLFSDEYTEMNWSRCGGSFLFNVHASILVRGKATDVSFDARTDQNFGKLIPNVVFLNICDESTNLGCQTSRADEYNIGLAFKSC